MNEPKLNGIYLAFVAGKIVSLVKVIQIFDSIIVDDNTYNVTIEWLPENGKRYLPQGISYVTHDHFIKYKNKSPYLHYIPEELIHLYE